MPDMWHDAVAATPAVEPPAGFVIRSRRSEMSEGSARFVSRDVGAQRERVASVSW